MSSSLTLPHQSEIHSRMLGDKRRLECFRRSIRSLVGPDDCVVDIGTGTGILASYAASQTQNKVYALEYFEQTAKFAGTSIHRCRNKNVDVIASPSFGGPINASPDVVITETIGAVGPEENIVEICYEFKKRYPSIRCFIPSLLSVYAVPVKSEVIRQTKQDFLTPFVEASHAKIDFTWALKDLERNYCQQLLGMNLAGALELAPPCQLACYQLGQTRNSSFDTTLNNNILNCDAVHIYFVAKLSEEIHLSSHLQEPWTHWQHRYVCRPQNATSLSLSYTQRGNQWRFKWA